MIPAWDVPDDVKWLMNRVLEVDAAEYPAMMAKAVQRISNHKGEVGDDIMVVLLMRDEPVSPAIEVAPSKKTRDR